MINNYPQLDDRAREVLRNAGENAHSLGHTTIEPEHVLLGILDEGSGVTDSFLIAIDRSFQLVRDSLKNRMPRQMPANDFGQLPRSRTTTQLIEHAIYEASASDVDLASPVHLVLGILRVRGTAANETLEQLGIKIDDIRRDASGQQNAR